jgi:hypothetical protein
MPAIVQTDFGPVLAVDDSHLAAPERQRAAYEAYVTKAIEPSYLRGDVILGGRFVGFARWLKASAQGRRLRARA